jgi:phage-related protein
MAAREYNVVANFIARTQDFVSGLNNARQSTNTFMNNFRSTMNSGQNSINRFGSETERQTGRIGKAFSSLKESLSEIAGAYIGFEAVKEGVKTLGESFIESNADMETYENTLTTVMKSHKKAVETLQWAVKFAASTPFEIPEIVDATAKLTTYGINAKNVLTDIGNMASVMGKPLDQAVEAVADAQTGELERLKEFGITKQMLMNKSQELYGKELVNSKGQITDMQLLNKTLFAVMEERYKGGMDMASKSFKGLESNLEDAMGTMARTLGKPIFDKFKVGLQTLVPIVTSITSLISGNTSGAMQTLVDAFGQNTADKIYGFFMKVKDGANSVIDWFGKFKPSIDNLKGAFLNLLPDIQSAGNTLGNILSNAIKTIADILPPVVNKITEFTKNLTAWEGFIPIVSGLVAGFATFKTIIFVIEVFNKVKLAIEAVKASMLLLNASFLANPITWIVALLVGLGVALYEAYQKSETFRDIVNGVWTALKDGFAAVIDWFTTTIPQWISDIGNWFTKLKDDTVSIFNSIAQFFSTVWDGIKSITMTVVNAIVSAATDLFNTFKGSIQTIFDGLSNFFQGVWTVIKNTFLGTVLLILDLVTGNFGKLKTDAEGIFNNLKSAFSQIWTGIKEIFSGALDFIKTYISTVWNAVKSVTSTVWDGIKSVVTTSADGIKSGISAAWDWIKSTTSSIWGSIKSFFTSIVPDIKNSVVNGFEGLKTGASNKMSDAKNAITGIWNKIIEFFNGIDLKQIGINIIQGLIDGIGSMASAVIKKVKSIADSVGNTIRDVLGIHSPSRVMMEIGKFVGQGLALGIDGTRTLVNKSALGLAEASNFSNFLPSITPSFNGLSNSLSASSLQKQPVNNQNTHNTYYSLNNVTIKTDNAETFLPDLQRIIKTRRQ